MPNRLAASTSPYLQQHRDNPVDWREWGEDAFAEARRRNVPVLLSVGYAACHWCHVMAHESFEDDYTANMMNESFVCVKVDREERPDVDAVYMEATQAMTGSGGWPMTCFLTPKGEPFFCGTYFPQIPFRRLLSSVTRAWEGDREKVLAGGADIVRQLHEHFGGPRTAGHAPSAELLDAGIEALGRTYDGRLGGFGSAPKFPPSSVLEFLLRAHARTGNTAALAMVERTCEAMARGGIYDQLGGGFARYSVDASWIVPHFEKMLYDNGLLLRDYLHLWRQTGSALAARVVRETAEFLLRDLRTAEGGFASALDADTIDDAGHGVEGLTYVWTPQQLVEVLGEDDGGWAARLFDVTADGTFEHGTSVLQLLIDPIDPERLASVRARLFAARAQRSQPSRDDKVVAAWNGLAVAALVEAGALFDEPAWVEAAVRAAELVRDRHLVDGRLRRASRDGVVGVPAGVLEDYGAVAAAWLAVHQVTGDLSWLTAAEGLLEVALTRFPDGSGGFYDTADDAEALVRRPQDVMDGATPSGSSLVCGALLTYAALTGSRRHREAAETAIAKVAPLFRENVRFAGEAAAVAEAMLAGPAEVAVVGRPDLVRLARLGTSPGAVVVTAGPLTEDRPDAAVYVCRHFACERPLTDAAEVRERLAVRLPA
ncbi:MAG TPA: thioredoxin domain-containing protein [Frankiaceae bacterium]|nr:thioredoxin domain-containing protein [Frankiaceae bacterium]